MQETVQFVRDSLGGGADIAVVLGSGVRSLADRIDPDGRCFFSSIEGMPAPSVSGHAGEFVRGSLGGRKVILQCGRLHFYEGHDMSQVILPTRLLYHLGVRTLIITNAAGGLSDQLVPGALMVIDDHINFLGASPLRGRGESGPSLPELDSPFCDMSKVYDPTLIDLAKGRAKKLGIELFQGVYVAFSGPAFETPAEIRMAGTFGADAVGMSTVPEAMTARALGVSVLGFSLITNKGAGLGDETLTHEQTLRESRKAEPSLSRLIEDIVSHIEASP